MYANRVTRPRERRRRGVALLLVLALLTIAACMAGEIAVYSFGRVQEVLETEKAAHRRWVEMGCRRLLLSRAGEILENSAAATAVPASENTAAPNQLGKIEARLVFNDLTVDLILADEQAKADVHVLAAGLESAEATSRIREALASQTLPLRLRNSTRSDASAGRSARFVSWGQVFDFEVLREEMFASFPTLVANLTCWGGGRLNVHRASSDVLRVVTRDCLDDDALQRLENAVRKTPQRSIAEIFTEARLTERELERLSPRLTDRSTRYSLWTTCRDSHRLHRTFCVVDATAATQDVAYFVW